MDNLKDIDRLLTYEASQWLESVRSGTANNEALHAWLLQSQLHTDAFLKMLALDMELDLAGEEVRRDPQRNLNVAALVRSIEPGVTLLRPAIRSSEAAMLRPRRQRRIKTAIAAGVAITAISASLWMWSLQTQSAQTTVITAAGEQRTVTLPDTSRVTLNNSSRIQVRYSAAVREIKLRGEGVFTVTRDPARPFIVSTPSARIRAVGTEFNVQETTSSGAIVSVFEGRVQVMPLNGAKSASAAQYLDAGEALEIQLDGKTHRRPNVDVARVASWHARRLPLEGVTLEELIREFNRYSGSQFQIEGPAPSTRYGGIFNATDAQSLADYLSRESDLLVERRGDLFVVRIRPKKAL